MERINGAIKRHHLFGDSKTLAAVRFEPAVTINRGGGSVCVCVFIWLCTTLTLYLVTKSPESLAAVSVAGTKKSGDNWWRHFCTFFSCLRASFSEH